MLAYPVHCESHVRHHVLLRVHVHRHGRHDHDHRLVLLHGYLHEPL